MSYSMEAEIEATRLEEQVFQINYLLSEELKPFTFTPNERVLDAGCGTGVLSRYLMTALNVKQIEGIDGSELRIRQAQNILKSKGLSGIRFSVQNLNQIDPQFYNTYDTVICRYVLEHVEDPVHILKELKKTLKPQGRIIVIDLDGVFVNLQSDNVLFQKYMNRFKSRVKFDLNIGSKLPLLMKQAGFANIKWNVELLCCKGDSLLQEKENTEKRFSAFANHYQSVFDTFEEFMEFQNVYLSEMMKPENTLVFNKYLCSGASLNV